MKQKILFFLCSFIFIIETNAQCAMCRAVLESEGSESAAKGINNGIVYLMAVPYVLVFGIGYFVYRKYMKSK